MNRHQRRTVKALNKSAIPIAASPDAKVLIAIPSGPHWFGEFAMCVIQMILDTVVYPTPGWGTIAPSTRNIRGSIIWKQRTDLIQGALDMNCTHLLFVDTDQTFPANTLRRLISHKKPVVAANVCTKQIPTMPTARKMNAGQLAPVFTQEDSRGLEEVYRIGTGIMMIDLSIMKEVKKPWFKVSWDDEGGEQYGEDWWFCMQLEKAGIPIYIDHELSWEVGHIGSVTYQHWHVDDELIAETEDILANGTPEEKGKLMTTVKERLATTDARLYDAHNRENANA